jgi:hypothetical protein
VKRRTVLALLVAAYAVLGLGVLAPEAVYSGDIGVKFVQAQALADHRFTSLDIPYPAEFVDPERRFFPMRPPFVMTAAGATQAIFSPFSAALQACAVALAGFRGMIVLSILGAALALYGAGRLAPPAGTPDVLLAFGVASPLWFYAISGWEHAPAVGLGAAGFACAWHARTPRAWLAAGAFVGLGAAVRDEVVLLMPGMLFAIWLQARTWRALALAIVGVAIPLAMAALMEVWWFERPAAAHLRHAVHLLRSALHATDAANPDVPVLRPMKLTERYDTVIEYWLVGYGHGTVIAGLTAAFAAGVWVRWRWGTSAVLLLPVACVVYLAWADLWELITAPKWLAGLHRVAPYLLFAFVPAGGTAVMRRLQLSAVVTTAAYLALAFAGVDTTGGKSLGPRLLLPLMPVLTAAAVPVIVQLLRAPARPDRWLGGAGVALLVMSAAMHLAGTIPAYYLRNTDDAGAVRAAAAAEDRLIVADDQFTAQLLLPLYERKIILLADSRHLGRELGATLAAQRLRRALVVSRNPAPAVALPPLRLGRTEQHGRMVFQYWEP